MKKPACIALGIILIVIGPCIFLTGIVYTLMQPNIYESTARIAVQDTAPKTCAAPCPHCSLKNPTFLRTQMEQIQSKPVLYEVMKRLDLQAEWGHNKERLPRNVALKIIQNSIRVYQQRDTSLIAIAIQRDDPNEAALIANEIAATYRDSRLDLLQKENQNIHEKLQETLNEQQARVKAAETAVSQLQTELDLTVDGDKQTDVDDLRLQRLEGDRLFAQKMMNEKKFILKVLEDLEDRDLIERASYISFDPVLLKIVEQLQDIDVQLASLDTDLGPEHPKVKRYRQQKTATEDVLKQRIITLRKGIEAEYTLAKSNFDELDKLLATPHVLDNPPNSNKSKSFRKVQTTLETERYIYKQLEAKVSQELITQEIPQNHVEIIDVAEPNMRPVSPNLFINTLMFLALASVPMISGIVLLVCGLRKRSVQ